MGLVGQVTEIGLRAHGLHDFRQTASRTIEIEGVGCAHGQMDLAVEIALQARPVPLDNVGDVVIVSPVGRDRRVYPARYPVEQRHWATIRPTRGKHPLERAYLAAI